MKLFTKSMEPNTTLGVAERVAYMSGNIGIIHKLYMSF